MSSRMEKDEILTESRATPINAKSKNIEKTGTSKTIFGTLKTEEHEHETQTPQNKLSPQQQTYKKFQYSANHTSSPQRHEKQAFLKQSHFIKEPSNSRKSQMPPNSSKISQHNQIANLQSKILFLEHCMNEYKQQVVSVYSKLQERQKYYKEVITKYEHQIIDLKQQIFNHEKQAEGQSKLIEECHEKYDSQVKEREMCLKLINEQKALIEDLNRQIDSLQRAVASTRQVSVGLIKENENVKAQILIQTDKYHLLYQDYGLLSMKYEQEVKEMHEENRILIRKLDDVEMELKIHQKDKEIQKLLIYEDSIQKRQRELIAIDQASSSPPSVVYYPEERNSSPYDYRPRRLNFEDQGRSGKKAGHIDKQNIQKQSGQSEIIELQKSKISNLETQLKQYEKRNKELQTLMVKLMK